MLVEGYGQWDFPLQDYSVKDGQKLADRAASLESIPYTLNLLAGQLQQSCLLAQLSGTD